MSPNNVAIAVSDAPKGKGGAAETVRPIQDFTMLKVAERPAEGKAKDVPAKRFHTVSDLQRASLWLTEQVLAAADEITSQIVDLTPELATVLIERNPGNRKLSDNLVEQFARDISLGNWPFNGESVIVSSDGLLNDGQHRCAAVIKAKRPIKVVLVIGAERETRVTLDQGRNRLISDYLAMDGHSGAPILASAAYIAWQIDKYGFTTRSRDFRPTKGELMTFVKDHGGLEKSVNRIPQYGVRKIGGRPVLAFCHWKFSNWATPAEADAFIDALISGAGLSKGSPILYVRNRLADKALPAAERVELIYRGWNAHRRDEMVSRIVVVGGKLPDLEV